MPTFAERWDATVRNADITRPRFAAPRREIDAWAEKLGEDLDSLYQTKGRPMTDRMLQFFAYTHLPAPLQAISQPFGELAQTIVDTLPGNPERTVALRKLLEAKDCAVRAHLFTAD